MQIVSIDFPSGMNIHTAVQCVNESHVQHLLLQFVQDQNDSSLVGVFRGSRDGDESIVKTNLHEWMLRWREQLLRTDRAKVALESERAARADVNPFPRDIPRYSLTEAT